MPIVRDQGKVLVRNLRTISVYFNDVIAPFKDGKVSAEAIPHAQFFPLKGAGHIPFFDSKTSLASPRTFSSSGRWIILPSASTKEPSISSFP